MKYTRALLLQIVAELSAHIGKNWCEHVTHADEDTTVEVDFIFITVWRLNRLVPFYSPSIIVLSTKGMLEHLWPEFNHIYIWHLKDKFWLFQITSVNIVEKSNENSVFCARLELLKVKRKACVF